MKGRSVERGAWSVFLSPLSSLPSSLFSVPREASVRPHSEQEEQGAQDIFPLGNPSYRFDVEWMQGE
jgi:hypothetical protein